VNDLEERNVTGRNDNQRWDHFPNNEPEEDDDFEHIEEDQEQYLGRSGGRTKEQTIELIKLNN